MLGQIDKDGGRPVGNSNSGAMNSFINHHGMIDLGFTGNWYTWCNGRQGRTCIQERLDRALANGEWTSLFPYATIRHLPHVASDHASLLLKH